MLKNKNSRNKKDSRFNISILMFILIFYILFILINDYLCFIFKENFNLIFYGISFLICISISFLLHKKIKITGIEFNKLDLLLIFILIWVFWCRMAIPDSSFDTLNYHLYLQNRLFSNNVSFNFFPARWINTFSFPLGDRMNGFIRYLFGYRLGTILDIFILIVVYYQVKFILSKFISNKYYIATISGIILLTEQILANMVTYYVDLISIPIILEIIIVITSSEKKNNFHNCYLLLLSGILCALKISNGFYVIPFAIIYLIKNHKTINYKTFIFGTLLFILPVFVYALNNYLQTGNPVFPFYNSIFKSKYYLDFNWVEDFYGPKTFLERLFWPIYIIWCSRRANDYPAYYNRIGYGYIVALIVLGIVLYKKFVAKKKIDEYEKFCILYIALCLVWSNFVLGYLRYGLFLEVLSGIVIAIFLYRSIISKFKFSIVTTFICLYMFTNTFCLTISDMFKTSYELSWRNTYYVDEEGYKLNKRFLYDRKWDYSKQTKGIDCVGILDYNSGYASLMFDEKTKILDLNEGYYTEYGKKELEKIKKQCKNIYTISTTHTLERTERYLEKKGYVQKGDTRKFKADFLNYYNDIVLIEIEDINNDENK